MGFAPGSAAWRAQRRLLEAEGVVCDDRDRVDLRRFGWRPAWEESERSERG